MMSNLVVDIYSFGFSFSGIQNDPNGNNGGFVFDCRFLPNPGREKEYANLTGRDEPVINYLEKYPEVEKYFSHILSIIDMAIDNYQTRNFSNLMISFGCTGGQHRSVYFAERLLKYLNSKQISTKIHHVEQDF